MAKNFLKIMQTEYTVIKSTLNHIIYNYLRMNAFLLFIDDNNNIYFFKAMHLKGMK